MRAFLAVEIDEKLMGKIAAVQKQFSESEAPVKYVETENLHYTLKFFGEIDKKKAKDIIKVVENKIQDYKPFKVNIKKSGAFPSEKYIRVLWLGMEDVEQFSTLQKDLDTEFINMGFKKERSYIPHLTIGRVKGAGNKEELLSKLKELEDVEIGKMTINKLVLKKSDLTPLGPIYTTLKEFDLK